MLSFLSTLLTYLLFFFIAFFLFLLYTLIISPLLTRRYYSHYRNIFITGKFIPIYGDFYHFINDIREGKVYYDHWKKMSGQLMRKEFDFKLFYEGKIPVLHTVSTQSRKEMQALMPSKIDRYPLFKGFNKFLLNSCVTTRSTKDWMDRLQCFLQELSMNSSSKYIPHMIKAIQHIMGKWQEGKEYEAINQMNRFTFTAFTMVLYGKDMENFVSHKLKYDKSNGTTEDLTFIEYFFTLINEHVEEFSNPVATFFPFVEYYNLVDPFKRNARNLNRYVDCLKELMDKSTDENSIYSQILKKSKINKDTLSRDFLAFLFAGSETASHNLTVCLYQLKKNPEVLQKLIDELESKGFKRFEDNFDQYTLERLGELDYLTYVIKEALRIDGPAPSSLAYKCYEDVTICGVKIPKGQEIRYEQLNIHYDENEWIWPYEFIPERFDPESEYFKKPNSGGKARTPLSHVPFSFGPRVCAGSSYALLEMKVALLYILTHVEYDVDENFFKKEGIGYGVGSECVLDFKVVKIKH
jgi:cytochrome P450